MKLRAGGEVLVEEAGEGLGVERLIGSGQLYRELWVGGGGEGFIQVGSSRDKELGGVQGGQRLGQGEVLTEERADREEAGAGVTEGNVEQIGVGAVKNDAGDAGMGGGEVGGEGGSDAGAVRDDLLRRDGAGGGEVLPGGLGVLGHLELVGTAFGAESVAAIVEGEDVDAETLQGVEGGGEVGQGAVAAGEKEDGCVGVTGSGGGGKPDAGSLRDRGLVGTEVDEVGRGLRCSGVNRVEDELPLTLIEEQAEGEIAAEERDDYCDAQGFKEPQRADDFYLSRGLLGALVGLWRGAGHFYMNFSIWDGSGVSC